MELLIALGYFGRLLVNYCFIAPISWVADKITSRFFPYEGDTDYQVMHLSICAVIGMIIVGFLAYYFH